MEKKNRRYQKIEGAVLFLDISGFTNLTSKFLVQGKAGADELAQQVNDLFQDLIDCIYKNHGFVMNYAGDAICAAFPNTSSTNPIQGAESAAAEICHYLVANKAKKSSPSDFDIAARIGLAAGVIEIAIVEGNDSKRFLFSSPVILKATQAQIRAEIKSYAIDRSFRLYSFNTMHSVELDELKSNDYFDQSLYIPDSILTSRFIGELKNATAAFIGFDAKLGFKEFCQHISKLIALSQKHNGFCNQIEVLDKGSVAFVVFGAHQSCENRFERAVDFAVDISDQIPAIKIGLSDGICYCGITGGVQRYDYSIMGEKVNLSARLMAQCEPGNILVDESSIKTATRYAFSKVGNYNLKGFSGPTTVFAVKRRKTEVTNNRFFDNKFIARDNEIAKLTAFLDDRTDLQLISIEGTAGVGKSRLCYESVYRHSDTGGEFHFIELQADSAYHKSFSLFKPTLHRLLNIRKGLKPTGQDEFNLAFNTLIEKFSIGDVNPEVERTRSYIASILDVYWDDSIFEMVPIEEKSTALAGALLTFFKFVASTKKLIIIAEDCDLLEPDILDILLDLSKVESAKLILTARGPIPHLSKRVAEKRTCHLQLAPFNVHFTKEFLTNQLGTEISDQLSRDLFQKSAGNPFFLTELADVLRAKRLIRIKSGKACLASDIDFDMPSKVSDIVLSKLNSLGNDLQDLIKIAATDGREINIPALEEVYLKILGKSNFKSILHQGLQHGIWKNSENACVFVHSLFNEIIYSTILAKDLAQIHQTYACVFRKHQQDVVSLERSGFHFYLAKMPLDAATSYYQAEELLDKAAFDPPRQANILKNGLQALEGVALSKNHHRETKANLFSQYLFISSFYSVEELDRSKVKRDLESLAENLDNFFKGKLYRGAAWYFSEFDVDSSLQYCRKATDLLRFDDDKQKYLALSSYKCMGQNFNRQQRFDKSIKIYEKIIENKRYFEPDDYYIFYSFLVTCHALQGEMDKASAYFHDVLENIQDDQSLSKMTRSTINATKSVYLDRLGKFSEGEQSLSTALESRIEIYGESSNQVAQLLFALGDIKLKIGKYRDAESAYGKARDINLELGGEDHYHLALTYNGLGRLYLSIGKLNKAKHFFELSAVITAKKFSKNSLNFNIANANLVKIDMEKGILGNLDRRYFHVLEKLKDGLPDNHFILTSFVEVRAMYDLFNGKIDESAEAISRCIKSYEDSDGKDHYSLVYSRYVYANALVGKGKFAQARAEDEEALRVANANQQENTVLFFRIKSHLAMLNIILGDFKTAQDITEESLAWFEEKVGLESVYAADPLDVKARLDMHYGRHELAIRSFQKVLDIREGNLHQYNLRIANVYQNISVCLLNQDKAVKARGFLMLAKEIYEANLGTNNPLYATCLRNIASTYLSENDLEKSRDLFNQCLELRLSLFGSDHIDVCRIKDDLSRLDYLCNQKDKALDNLLDSLLTRASIASPYNFQNANSCLEIARIYYDSEMANEVVRYCQKALDIQKRNYSESHQVTAEIYQLLAETSRKSHSKASCREYIQQVLKIKEDLYGEPSREKLACLLWALKLSVHFDEDHFNELEVQCNKLILTIGTIVDLEIFEELKQSSVLNTGELPAVS